MKIVCLSERQYGCGASIAGYRLALALADAGHEVHWWYARPFAGDTPEGERLRMRQLPAAPAFRKWEGGFARLSTYLWGRFLEKRWQQNERAIHAWLDETGADVVLLNNIDHVLDHARVSRLADRLPVVWLIHSNLALEPWHYRFALPDGGEETAYSYPPTLVDRAAQLALLDHPNLQFVTPSNWLAQHNKTLHGDRLRVTVIPYAVDPAMFYPERSATHREERIRILFVASNLAYPRKNIRVLLDALPHLPADRFHFLALGEDTDRLAERYPMIEFLSPSYNPADLRRHYSEADYFFIPSLIDNLPNTVLESLFCGTPVIGSRTGGIPDMVVPGQSGLLFDPYDAADLTRVLIGLLETPPPVLRGATLQGWARSRYGKSEIAALWTDFLARL